MCDSRDAKDKSHETDLLFTYLLPSTLTTRTRRAALDAKNEKKWQHGCIGIVNCEERQSTETEKLDEEGKSFIHQKQLDADHHQSLCAIISTKDCLESQIMSKWSLRTCKISNVQHLRSSSPNANLKSEVSCCLLAFTNCTLRTSPS